jgi:hypothetical protein
MDSKASAASAILRRFAVALKTYTLYPPPSPVTDRAIGEVLAGLHTYIETNGPFTVRVSRRSFQVNEATFKDATSASLALHLYARKVIGFAVLPGVTAQEITTFLTIVRQDRVSLEGSGGIAGGMRRAGVQTIRVMEIVLAVGAAAQDESWGALWDLMGDGQELTAENHQFVVDILRSGPGAIGGLFEQLRTMLGNAADDQHLDWSQTLYDVVKNLDRIIATQSSEDREQFYSHVAAAILLLEDPVRMPLQRTLTAPGSNDEMARVLLDHLSEQRLVGIVPRNSLESSGGEGPGDLLALDPEMQILHAQQPQTAVAGSTSLPLPAGRPADDGPPESIRIEMEGTDEASVAREVIGTLVDMFRNQADESEIVGTIRSLDEYLPWLVGQEDFSLLRVVLQGLRDGAAKTPAHERAVTDLTDGVAKTRLLNTMVDTLWNGRGTPVEEELRLCLSLLGSRIVAPLMMILGEESRAGTRRMLCDIIVTLARDRIDDVGVFATDGRWYLTRNVAYILGRLGDPRGMGHIARLASHRDHRVRSEAVAALASIGGQEADALLAKLLDDVDGRIRLKAVLSMSDTAVLLSLPKLLHLLARLDPMQLTFALKQEIIASLARSRAKDAIPALVRFSQHRLAFGRRPRTLRRLAGEAVATIQAFDGAPNRMPPAASMQARPT